MKQHIRPCYKNILRPITQDVKLPKAEALLRLKNKIMSDVTGIPYKSERIVFGSYNIDAEVMIIGEAPGQEEDKAQIPFVGRSGQLIRQMFEAIGIKVESCYVTNVLMWRPPMNRTPSDKELLIMMPFLIEHLKIINPKILVTVGNIATKTVFNKKNIAISSVRGVWHIAHGIPTLPIFHPSYLLRSPGQKKFAWQDMITIKKRLQN